LDENEIKNVKGKFKNQIDDEIYANSSKVRSNGNFKVSEFDPTVDGNDKSNNEENPNSQQRFTFSGNFQFGNSSNRKASHKTGNAENKHNDKQFIKEIPPDYLALETNAKEFCCSSKNVKCLIF